MTCDAGRKQLFDEGIDRPAWPLLSLIVRCSVARWGPGDGYKGDGKRPDVHRIAPLIAPIVAATGQGSKARAPPLDQHLPQDCGCHSHHQEHHAGSTHHVEIHVHLKAPA